MSKYLDEITQGLDCATTAARGIETEKTLAYLIGMKLSNFLEPAEVNSGNCSAD